MLVNEDRIAGRKLAKDMLGVSELQGKRFLDIGSGIFSLAARRLGAAVHSFDYDHSLWPAPGTTASVFFGRQPVADRGRFGVGLGSPAVDLPISSDSPCG